MNLLDNNAWQPFVNYSTAFDWAKEAWVYYPEVKLDTRNTATYPRLTTRQNDNNYRPSSFWVKKNTYLRLSNVEVGYNIPFGKSGSDILRVFVQGQDLLTLSPLLWKYKMDPETTSYGYPSAMSVCAGLQITF